MYKNLEWEKWTNLGHLPIINHNHFFMGSVLAVSAVCLLYSNWFILDECIALWGKPNELSIQYRIYIFIQYVDS